jgi:tricorn protease
MPSLRPASRNRRAVSFVALLLAPGAFARNADTAETLLLQQPTISKDHVVFVYARDLWAAPRAGGVARRLTSDDGAESSPKLSPDGKWVAFTGQYEGNSDVYVAAGAAAFRRRAAATDLASGQRPRV